MNYLEKNLLKGEEIVFAPHLHWEPFLTPSLFSVLLVGLYFVLDYPWFVFLAFLLSIKIIPGFIGAIVFLRTTEYCITNQRVFSKTGLFTTVSSDLMLEKIESASVVQPFLGKLFNYGHVAFSGDGGKDLVVVLITDPYEFKKKAYR